MTANGRFVTSFSAGSPVNGARKAAAGGEGDSLEVAEALAVGG